MEEKQLDFSAPLMSVRRFSSTSTASSLSSSSVKDSKRTESSSMGKKQPYLPAYKSELKSGPMRNPGAVPFHWEQIPGRPKEGGNPKPQFMSVERPPITPKLPPGRVREAKQQSLDKEVKDPDLIKPHFDNVHSIRRRNLISDANVSELESPKNGLKGSRSSGSEQDDDDNDAFIDAPDTLSRTESFFNCSISGVSGLDGPDAKPSGIFSTDPETRDFMMGRFLPAAKAMTSETPQYAQRKQPVVREREQPRQVINRVVNADRKLTVYQYQPTVVPEDAWEEESSEDDEEDYDDTRNISAKACGIFPRFCLRNSLLLLNPVPGMKVRSRAPVSSVRKVKTHDLRSRDRTDYEKTRESVYKHKLISGRPIPDEESKLRSESNQLKCLNNSQTHDGSSHHSPSPDGGISPYRNEATQSPFNEGVGFLGVPKEVPDTKYSNSYMNRKHSNDCHAIVPYQSTEVEQDFMSPTIEKTLYIDSVQVMENRTSSLSSVDTKGSMDFMSKDSDNVVKSRFVEETPGAESLLQDIDHLNISKERGSLQSKDCADADLDTSFDISNHVEKMYSRERFRKDDVLDQENRFLRSSKTTTGGNMEIDYRQAKEDDPGNLSLVSYQAPLAPPLPKSPSESWLWRTLPSVSSRSGSPFSRKQAPQKSSSNPKWETIVKTSNVHHSHLRFSEEQITPVSQKSET